MPKGEPQIGQSHATAKDGAMKNRRPSYKTSRRVFIAMALCVWTALSSCGGSGGSNQTSNDISAFLGEKLRMSRAKGATLCVITPAGEFTAAVGLSDPANNIASRSSDRLRIASMTKTFTTVAALKTLERYGVALDAVMGNYVANPPLSLRNVTFRQALGMTAGMPDYINAPAYDKAVALKPSRQQWTAAEILDLTRDMPSLFMPGSAYNYSNTNFIAIQAALESLTGQPMAAILREHTLDALGLGETFMELAETRDGGFGGVTARGFENGVDVTEVNDSLGMADGGLVSTATELARFMKALAVDKSLLSSSLLSEMTAWRLADSYGLGLERISGSLGEGWGHSGASAGFSGAMAAWPDKGAAAAILTNDLDSGMDEFALLEEAVKRAPGL